MFDLIDHILLYLPIFYYPIHYSRLIYVTVVNSLQSNDETFRSWVLVYLDRERFPMSLSTTWGNHLPFNSMLKVPIYYLEKPPSIIRLDQSCLTTTLSFILIYMSNVEVI